MALVGRRPRRVLAGRVGRRRHPLRDPAGPALADARMPGARWFPGATLNYAEHALALAGPRRRRRRGRRPVADARTRGPHGGRAARRRRALPCRARARGRPAWRPCRGVPADDPRDARRASCAAASLGATWSSCAPEFGTRAVADRFGQIEPVVLLTVDGYRYGDRDIDRAAEVAELRAALPTVRTTVVVPYLRDEAAALEAIPGAVAWSELLAEAGAARLRAGAVRPPAVHPVLLGHDRPPQADRPRARRDPPRALEGARAPHRPRARGPLLLVHDDRLDDVELPRVGPPRRLDRRAVRRQPGVAGPLHAVAPGRGRAGHVPRRERAVPHGLPRRRPRAGRGPHAGPGRAARGRVDRRAAPRGGLPVGPGRGLGRDPGGLAVGRDGPVHGLPRPGTARAGLGRRDQLPDARREGRGVRSRGPVARRRHRASS